MKIRGIYKTITHYHFIAILKAHFTLYTNDTINVFVLPYHICRKD